MRGKLSHGDDLGFDRNRFTEKVQQLGAFLQRAAPRALGLETRENYRVLGVRQPLRQMVQYAATGHHSARGNNDAWSLNAVDCFGVVGRSRQMKLMHVQWIVIAGGFQLGEIEIVVILIFNVEIGGAECHRTIDVDRNVWNFAVVFQLPQVVHKSLRAPDGEGRNDDGAAALDHTIYDARKFGSWVAGFVLTIAVC